MRLLSAEFGKLFTHRIFTACLILFLAANVLILNYEQSADFMTKLIHDNRQLYNELIDGCKGKTVDETEEYLEEQSAALTIFAMLKSSENETDPDMLAYRKESIEQMKEKYPNAYKLALTLDISKNESAEYSMLVEDLKEQRKSHESFTQGIEEMEEHAQQQSFFSIFSEEGSFAKANTEKTLNDFQAMKGRTLTLGNNFAVTAATNFNITDYFVFAIVFAACIFLFTTERDKNLYCLIRSTKYGRFPLISAKLAALATVAVCVSLVYYSSSIAAAAWYTGLGDTSRTIQSVSIFHNCNLSLTICEYLILWILTKTFAVLAVAFLLALIFTLIKNTSTVAIVCALLFGAEFILCSSIDRNSWINQLKFINIFCFVSGNQIIGDYLNLNLFTVPVNMVTIYLVGVPMIAAVSLVLTCVMFVKQTQFAKAAAWDRLVEKIRVRFARIIGSVSVFSGESFKHYKGSLVWLVIVLLLCFGYSSLKADLTFNYTDPAEMLYSDYMKQLEGELTPEKERFIEEEKLKISEIYAKIAEVTADNTIDEYEKASILDGLTRSVENREKGFAMIAEQYDYIKAAAQERGLTPMFVDTLVYKRLLQNPVKEWRYLAVIMLAVIFSSSNIFACEYRRDTVNLIRCAKKGKLRLVLAKLSVVFMTAIISYTLIYLPYMINFVKTFGGGSLNTPIIFIPDFAMIDSDITIIRFVCVVGAVHIVFVLAISLFVSMLSLVLKNNITVMIVSAVIILVPFIVFYGSENIRLFAAFMSGKQVVTIISVISASVVIAAVSFFVIIKIFFPLRRFYHART